MILFLSYFLTAYFFHIINFKHKLMYTVYQSILVIELFLMILTIFKNFENLR
jgi:hypothetical protein